MSLVIRFSNAGKRGERKYKVVVMEKRERREGKPLELLGHYEKRVGGVVSSNINKDRITHWVSKGAQLSPSVKKAIEEN